MLHIEKFHFSPLCPICAAAAAEGSPACPSPSFCSVLII